MKNKQYYGGSVAVNELETKKISKGDRDDR